LQAAMNAAKGGRCPLTLTTKVIRQQQASQTLCYCKWEQ
jgi:hypothetical protein